MEDAGDEVEEGEGEGEGEEDPYQSEPEPEPEPELEQASILSGGFQVYHCSIKSLLRIFHSRISRNILEIHIFL